MVSIIVSAGAPWPGRTCSVNDSQSYVVQCNTSCERLPYGEEGHSRVAAPTQRRILSREPDTSFLAAFAKTSAPR